MTRDLARVVLLCGLAACGPQPPKVSLSDVEPVPAGKAAAAPLRIAVSPMESPERTFAAYSELFSRVGAALGRPVEMVQRQTYSEVVSLVQHRRVDAALVCSGPYVQAQEEFGAEILAVPQVSGQTTYGALVVVRADSGYRSFDELRRRSFALTDSLSTTGMVYPACLVRDRKATTESYFSRVIFTHGHDNSMRAVVDGLVEGASVSSLVFADLARQMPAFTAKLRVIGRSPRFGNPPVIVHPETDPALKRSLREVLLRLHEEPGTAEALRRLGYERFVTGRPEEYEQVRRMRSRVLRGGPSS
jgi:phosphonate transport system substrate-binding protein